MKSLELILLLGAMSLLAVPARPAEDYCDVEVPVVSPGSYSPVAAVTPPSDAIVLFDGKELSEWTGINGTANWIVHDGIMTVKKGSGDIETKRSFQDIQLHIEWRIPPGVRGEGESRGNSGVYIQGRYEIQVLDSFQNRSNSEGQAGAVYGQTAPLVNAMRRPGEWNVYDIIYTAPRFNQDRTLFTPAHVTILHNGVLIQNNSEIHGGTGLLGPPKYAFHGPGPIRLQDHEGPGEPISYRNIWVRELNVPARDITAAKRDVRRTGGGLSVDSTMKQLLSSSGSREVLSRCIPALLPIPVPVEKVENLTLRQFQKYVNGLTDEKLLIIDAQLAGVDGAAKQQSPSDRQ